EAGEEARIGLCLVDIAPVLGALKREREIAGLDAAIGDGVIGGELRRDPGRVRARGERRRKGKYEREALRTKHHPGRVHSVSSCVDEDGRRKRFAVQVNLAGYELESPAREPVDCLRIDDVFLPLNSG